MGIEYIVLIALCAFLLGFIFAALITLKSCKVIIGEWRKTSNRWRDSYYRSYEINVKWKDMMRLWL
jgi:hypothetical protein